MLDLTVEDPPIEDVIEQVFARPPRRPPMSESLTPAPLVDRARGACARRPLYPTHDAHAIAMQFQYRLRNYFYMIGLLVEPVVYLVVWTTVAEASRAATVGGYTPGTFAAYYIVWTLVRNMNIVFTPYGWEWRIREGELSASCSARSTRSTTTSATSPAGRSS